MFCDDICLTISHTFSYAGNSSGKTKPADIIKLPSILVTKQLLFALLGVQNNTLYKTESDTIFVILYHYLLVLSVILNVPIILIIKLKKKRQKQTKKTKTDSK